MGETRCITLNIYNDTRVENEEYFILRIRNGYDYNTRIEGSMSARINILDDDGNIIYNNVIINTIRKSVHCSLIFYTNNYSYCIVYYILRIDISLWICCCFVHV